MVRENWERITPLSMIDSISCCASDSLSDFLTIWIINNNNGCLYLLVQLINCTLCICSQIPIKPSLYCETSFFFLFSLSSITLKFDILISKTPPSMKPKVSILNSERSSFVIVSLCFKLHTNCIVKNCVILSRKYL